MGRVTGIEPTTSWTTIRRSNRLSYTRQTMTIVPQGATVKKGWRIVFIDRCMVKSQEARVVYGVLNFADRFDFGAKSVEAVCKIFVSTIN